MSKTIRIVTLVEIDDDDIQPIEISDWIGGCLDNIDYEVLGDMGIDRENVSIGVTFPEGYESE